MKLFERGVPNETLFRIIEKGVRVPEQVLGDLQGQIAALAYGERELCALAERYGIDGLISYEEALLDYSEDLTRSAIRRAARRRMDVQGLRGQRRVER